MEYRTACGTPTRGAGETINQTTFAKYVTCTRCRETLKYQQLEHAERSTVGWCAKHNTKHLTNTACRNMALMEKENAMENSRTSDTSRTSSDPVQAALMKANPHLCCAIYRDGHGQKLYCPQPLHHDGACGDPVEPKPAQRRPVYCVHCQQYHSPDDAHRVSFDYPPIPYARELFEIRCSDLRTEMEEYIACRSDKPSLDLAIERIEGEYLSAMHDLFTLRLI
jgi:hypothetical protein